MTLINLEKFNVIKNYIMIVLNIKLSWLLKIKSMDQIEEFLLSLDNIYPQIEGYLSTKINYPVKVEIKNKGVKVLEFFNNIVKNYPNNIIENIEFDINEEFLMFKFTSTVDTIHELRLLHNGEKKLKDVLDNNFKS